MSSELSFRSQGKLELIPTTALGKQPENVHDRRPEGEEGPRRQGGQGEASGEVQLSEGYRIELQTLQ